MFATIKTAALASLVLVATTVGAFAATGHVTQDTKITKYPKYVAMGIGVAKEGEKVWIVDCQGAFCYIERKWGTDGWVLKSRLEVAAPNLPVPPQAPGPFPGFFGGYEGAGVSFCVGGENASFCIQGHN